MKLFNFHLRAYGSCLQMCADNIREHAIYTYMDILKGKYGWYIIKVRYIWEYGIDSSSWEQLADDRSGWWHAVLGGVMDGEKKGETNYWCSGDSAERREDNLRPSFYITEACHVKMGLWRHSRRYS